MAVWAFANVVVIIGAVSGQPGLHAAAGFLLVALATVPLVARRRWPAAVYWATMVPVLVYEGLGYPSSPAPAPAVVALYFVALVETRQRSAARGLFTIVSIVVLRGAPHGWTSPTVFALPGSVAAALFLGWAVANHRAYVAEITDRAERAERSKEEEARHRVDAERLRIARELHDVVAHSIATINVQAGAAAHVLADQPEQAAEALAAIKASSKEALRELRAILDVLRQADEADPMSPAPGLDQLGVLVSTATRAGVSTQLSVVGEPRPLPPAIGLAAYRIVQESLTNVLCHAGPAAASVLLAYCDHRVVIEVDDNGRGATDARDDSGRAGHGITGMRERAAFTGGSLEAGRRPEGGFRVRACLPTPEGS